GVRVVKDDGRPQLQAGDEAQPVSQLDCRKGVKAELLEGLVGADLLRGAKAEHGRHLCADEVKGKALSLCLWKGRELARKRALEGGAAFGGPRQGAQDRRQGAEGAKRPEPGSLERDSQRGGAWAGERLVEQGEALLVCKRLDRAALDPRPVGLAQVGGHAALA